MLPVNGLFGHVQRNHLRSLIMFGGFMLSMHQVVALLLSIPFPWWNHLPVLFDKPYVYVREMGPLVTAFNFIFFCVFYFEHNFFMRMSLDFDHLDTAASPRLHAMTANLATAAGIPVPKLNLIRTPVLNSFACGLSANSAQIVVTQGLLEALDDEELQAVIAHEVAHIKNGDVHMMAVANAAIGSIRLINFINPMKLNFLKHVPVIVWIPLTPIAAIIGILVLFYSFMMQFASLIANSTRFVISSSREYIADAEAVRLTHNPAALVSALNKIRGRSQMHGVGDLAASMMIDGPTTGRRASHPPIRDRMEKILELSGPMVHGTGARKDTRTRSLAAHDGAAFSKAQFAGNAPAGSFRQGFGYAPPPSTADIHKYIPQSPDYAAHDRPWLEPEQPDSIFDRISMDGDDDDAEFGITQPVRWLMIFMLGIFVYNASSDERADFMEKHFPKTGVVAEQPVELRR